MSSTSMKPEIGAALTITIESEKSVKFNPTSGEVPAGGVVKFRSGDKKRWEVQLWNKTNDDPHPLRLFVPEHDGAEMVADPLAIPANVSFNVMRYPGGKLGGPMTGGTYTIKITSTDGGNT